MFVYVIVNDVNLKIYVGKTVRKSLPDYLQRKVAHAKHGVVSRLYAAIRKHGREHFHIYSLISDCQTNKELCHWEQILIKALAAQNPAVGYNLSEGGEAGYYGCTHSPEMRQKIGNFHRGFCHSEETRRKISETRKGQPHPHKSHPHSEQTRQKLRQIRLGKTLSKETRLKLMGRTPWNKGIKWARQNKDESLSCPI